MKVVAILLLSTLCLGSGLSDKKRLGITFNDVMEIIGGVLVGMGADINATDIAPCVSDTAYMGVNLEIAAKDYLEHTYIGKVQAMAHLGLAYKELPNWILKCKPASVELGEAIARMVLAWAHPLSVIYHVGENLIVNGQEILADVSYAMGAWEYGLYYDFGFYCGKAGFKIAYIPPPKAQIAPSAVGDVLKGIAKSTSLPIYECIVESDAAELFDEVFNSEITFGDVSSSLLTLSNALDTLFGEFSRCSGFDLSSYFMHQLESLANPYSLYIHKRTIVLNGADLKDFNTARLNYRMMDWENTGVYIGKMLLALEA